MWWDTCIEVNAVVDVTTKLYCSSASSCRDAVATVDAPDPYSANPCIRS